MPQKKYLINLNEEDRQRLPRLTREGRAKTRQFKRAAIVQKADEGLKEEIKQGP